MYLYVLEWAKDVLWMISPCPHLRTLETGAGNVINIWGKRHINFFNISVFSRILFCNKFGVKCRRHDIEPNDI